MHLALWVCIILSLQVVPRSPFNYQHQSIYPANAKSPKLSCLSFSSGPEHHLLCALSYPCPASSVRICVPYWHLSPLLFQSCLSSRLALWLTTAAVNVSPIAISGRISALSGIQGWVIFNPSTLRQTEQGPAKGNPAREEPAGKPVLFLLRSRNVHPPGQLKSKNLDWSKIRLSYHL